MIRDCAGTKVPSLAGGRILCFIYGNGRKASSYSLSDRILGLTVVSL